MSGIVRLAEIAPRMPWRNMSDEPCPPQRRRRARPADFLTDRTLFDMWQLVVVSNEGESFNES